MSQKPTQNEIDDTTNEIDNDVDIIGYCRWTGLINIYSIEAI